MTHSFDADTIVGPPQPRMQAPGEHGAVPRQSREWRFGFDSGNTRYFLNVRLGIERRDDARLVRDGQQRLPLRTITTTIAGAIFFVAFGLLCFLYLLKSLLGIDLFTGNSPLHALFAAIVE